MRLNVQTDFALRTLIYLGAADDDGSRPNVARIAAAYGISRPHLAKVVQRLQHGGFIVTHPGRGGGIELAREPSEIVIGEVVRHMEPNLAPVSCLSSSGEPCAIVAVCELKMPMRAAADAFLEVLDGYTLADCIQARRPLQKLLQLR